MVFINMGENYVRQLINHMNRPYQAGTAVEIARKDGMYKPGDHSWKLEFDKRVRVFHLYTFR